MKDTAAVCRQAVRQNLRRGVTGPGFAGGEAPFVVVALPRRSLQGRLLQGTKADAIGCAPRPGRGNESPPLRLTTRQREVTEISSRFALARGFEALLRDVSTRTVGARTPTTRLPVQRHPAPSRLQRFRARATCFVAVPCVHQSSATIRGDADFVAGPAWAAGYLTTRLDCKGPAGVGGGGSTPTHRGCPCCRTRDAKGGKAGRGSTRHEGPEVPRGARTHRATAHRHRHGKPQQGLDGGGAVFARVRGRRAHRASRRTFEACPVDDARCSR